MPEWLPSPRELIEDPSGYVADHYRLLLRTLLGEVVLATALGWIASVLLHRRGESNPFDVMWTVLHEKRPSPAERPVVEVVTDDGSVFRGRVRGFDAAGPVSDRYIAIANATIQRPGGVMQPLPNGWPMSLVPLDHVREFHVVFIVTDDVEPLKKKWWQRIVKRRGG